MAPRSFEILAYSLNQRACYALPACERIDKQILQVADVLRPHTRVKQVVRDAKQLTVSRRAQAKHIFLRQQALPGFIVFSVLQRGFVKRFVASGKDNPAGVVFNAKRRDVYGHFLWRNTLSGEWWLRYSCTRSGCQ